MKHMLKCTKCGNYSLSDKCPECGSLAIPPLPAKYSPEDSYGDYRRKARREGLEKEGKL